MYLSSKVSDHGNFTSLDDGKDTPQKKLEDVESIKQMQDVCDLIPESVESLNLARHLRIHTHPGSVHQNVCWRNHSFFFHLKRNKARKNI